MLHVTLWSAQWCFSLGLLNAFHVSVCSSKGGFLQLVGMKRRFRDLWEFADCRGFTSGLLAFRVISGKPYGDPWKSKFWEGF